MTKQNQDLRIYGPDNYVKVGKQIEKAGLKKPTMAETASLAHVAFNSEGKYSDETKKMMKDCWLWVFTGALYIPKKGVYIQDDPKIKNGIPHMVESDLEKKLQKNDKSVRFVPFGYETRFMSASELAKNDFVKALAGEEGAEKLGEIAGKYQFDPYLWAFKFVYETKRRISAIYSCWGQFNAYSYSGWETSEYSDRGLDDSWLGVDSQVKVDEAGCALGVQKNTKEKK